MTRTRDPRHAPRSTRGSSFGAGLALSVVLFATGCGPSAASRPGSVRPLGTLHAPGSYASDFTIDQTVTAVHVGGAESFRAIVEKRGDRLVMVGLGPHGGRAFTLTEEGDAVAFESSLPRPLPFPPEFMLMDVHRTWLHGLPREADAPLADGVHTGQVDGENVEEVWAGGRLQHRAFRRPSEAFFAVDIAYEGGLDPRPTEPAPSRVVLDCQPAPEQHYQLVLEGITRTP